MTQYSIRPKWSAIHAQAVYFLHSTMPSVTCLWLSYVSIIYCVTYFQFLIQSAFLNRYISSQAASAVQRTIRFNMQYRTSDVAKDLGGYVSCTECTAQGKNFELILMIKMETKHPVDGQFGSEFLAICNHCRVMAAWSRKTWKFCVQFLRSLKKRTLTVKFWKFCSESFHHLTNRRCCVQMW